MHDKYTLKQNTTMRFGFSVLPNNALGQIIELDVEQIYDTINAHCIICQDVYKGKVIIELPTLEKKVSRKSKFMNTYTKSVQQAKRNIDAKNNTTAKDLLGGIQSTNP